MDGTAALRGPSVPYQEAKKIEFSLDYVMKAGETFVTEGEATDQTKISSEQIQSTFSTITGVLMAIGAFVVVLMGIILGIRLLSASPSEKADVKASMLPYVAGSLVVFGAFSIWKLVVDLLQQNL